MDHTEVREIATEKLGGYRLAVGGAMYELPLILYPRERILAMAVAATGEGRLVVATDKRLLIVSKWPWRRRRCREIRYGHIESVEACRSLTDLDLSVKVPGEEILLRGAMPTAAADELAELLIARSAGENAAAETVKEPRPSAAPGPRYQSGWDVSRRTLVFLAAATIAAGVCGGVLIKLAQPSAEEVTCAELAEDPTASLTLAKELAPNYETGEYAILVEYTIADELDQACDRADEGSYRPVNSDLRGNIRSALR